MSDGFATEVQRDGDTVIGPWRTRSTLSDVSGAAVAEVLLHQGVFKASYAGYPADRLG